MSDQDTAYHARPTRIFPESVTDAMGHFNQEWRKILNDKYVEDVTLVIMVNDRVGADWWVEDVACADVRTAKRKLVIGAQKGLREHLHAWLNDMHDGNTNSARDWAFELQPSCNDDWKLDDDPTRRIPLLIEQIGRIEAMTDAESDHMMEYMAGRWVPQTFDDGQAAARMSVLYAAARLVVTAERILSVVRNGATVTATDLDNVDTDLDHLGDPDYPDARGGVLKAMSLLMEHE